MIRTVEISPGGPMAQGDLPPCRYMTKRGFCVAPRCICVNTRRTATVRTGATTTATGRLIERERKSDG